MSSKEDIVFKRKGTKGDERINSKVSRDKANVNFCLRLSRMWVANANSCVFGFFVKKRIFYLIRTLNEFSFLVRQTIRSVEPRKYVIKLTQTREKKNQ